MQLTAVFEKRALVFEKSALIFKKDAAIYRKYALHMLEVQIELSGPSYQKNRKILNSICAENVFLFY